MFSQFLFQFPWLQYVQAFSQVNFQRFLWPIYVLLQLFSDFFISSFKTFCCYFMFCFSFSLLILVALFAPRPWIFSWVSLLDKSNPGTIFVLFTKVPLKESFRCRLWMLVAILGKFPWNSSLTTISLLTPVVTDVWSVWMRILDDNFTPFVSKLSPTSTLYTATTMQLQCSNSPL